MNLQLTPILQHDQLDQARQTLATHHYLHTYPDPRTMPVAYTVSLHHPPVCLANIAILTFGRPESTRFWGWYGSLEDVTSGRCPVTRWQVLNLSRVWIHPHFQAGGKYHDPNWIPGYIDRRSIFRSTLASAILRHAITTVAYDYLIHRPPVWLGQPYEITWLLSYCNTHLHRGTIYKSAGFELYTTNKHGIQTWRIPLPPLTPAQHTAIAAASRADPRANRLRDRALQLTLI